MNSLKSVAFLICLFATAPAAAGSCDPEKPIGDGNCMGTEIAKDAMVVGGAALANRYLNYSQAMAGQMDNTYSKESLREWQLRYEVQDAKNKYKAGLAADQSNSPSRKRRLADDYRFKKEEYQRALRDLRKTAPKRIRAGYGALKVVGAAGVAYVVSDSVAYILGLDQPESVGVVTSKDFRTKSELRFPNAPKDVYVDMEADFDPDLVSGGGQ